MNTSRLDRVLLWCGMAAGVLFTGTYLVAGALRSGYDPVRDPVSSLALTGSGWVQIANFLVAGTLTLGFVWGLYRTNRATDRPARITTALVATWGIGLLGAGVFVTDPVGDYPPGLAGRQVHTWHGLLHDVPFSVLAFFGMAAAMAAYAIHCVRHRRRRWALFSGAGAVVFLAGFIAAGLGFSQEPGFVEVGGLAQRITVSLGWIWVGLLAASRLREIRRRDTRR